MRVTKSEKAEAGLRLICKAGLTLAICAGSFAGASETAHAQTQGHIAYVSSKNSNGNNPTGDDEIWIMNADGTNKVQLTFNTLVDREPAITLDGSKIAFVQRTTATDGNGQPIDHLMTINPNGTNLTQLTWNNVSPEIGVINTPSWSPDNSRIIFSGTQQYIGAMQNIWAYTSAGLVGIPIFLNQPGANMVGYYQPSYSRDGTKVTYIKRNFQGIGSTWITYSTWHTLGAMTNIGGNMTDLRTIDYVNGQPSPAPIISLRPSYSVDGSKILYSYQGMMYLVTADGITNLGSIGFGRNAVFSPDGTRVAYENGDHIYSKASTSGGTAVDLVGGKYPSWGG